VAGVYGAGAGGYGAGAGWCGAVARRCGAGAGWCGAGLDFGTPRRNKKGRNSNEREKVVVYTPTRGKGCCFGVSGLGCCPFFKRVQQLIIALAGMKGSCTHTSVGIDRDGDKLSALERSRFVLSDD